MFRIELPLIEKNFFIENITKCTAKIERLRKIFKIIKLDVFSLGRCCYRSMRNLN